MGYVCTGAPVAWQALLVPSKDIVEPAHSMFCSTPATVQLTQGCMSAHRQRRCSLDTELEVFVDQNKTGLMSRSMCSNIDRSLHVDQRDDRQVVSCCRSRAAKMLKR